MAHKAAAKAKRLAIWGQSLIGTCFALLTLGGIIVRKFFPQNVGGGLSTGLLVILIPIWLIGIAGIGLSLAAWMTYPQLSSQLKLDFPKRPDGRYFGSLPRFLACLTVFFMCLGALFFLLSQKQSSPLIVRLITFYVVLSYSGFVVYICYIYAPRRHLAATTLISLLSPLLAFIIIPVAWPFLVWFSLQQDDRQRQKHKKQRR